jgi:hypothetical protein
MRICRGNGVVGWGILRILGCFTTTIRITYADAVSAAGTAPDLARCFTILGLSDVDENQRIEYFEFEAVAVYYGCPFNSISMESIFNIAACVCESYEETAEDCCNVKVIYRPDAQRYAAGYILQVCQILENMCALTSSPTATSTSTNATDLPSASPSPVTWRTSIPTKSNSTYTPNNSNDEEEDTDEHGRSTSRKWITGFMIGLGGSLVFTSFILLIGSTTRKVRQSVRNRNTLILGQTVAKGNMDGNDVFIDISSTGQLSSSDDDDDEAQDHSDNDDNVVDDEVIHDSAIVSHSNRRRQHRDHSSCWNRSLSDLAHIQETENDKVTHNNYCRRQTIHYAYGFSGIVQRADRKVRMVGRVREQASSTDIPIIEWTEFHPNQDL